MPTQKSLGAGGPPLTYRFDEVSIQMMRQSGNATVPNRHATLSGTGSASLERDGRTLPFRYAPEALLKLLNELYKIHFFDLPTNATARHSVSLKADGTVVTSVLRMSDRSSTRVCFALPSYEKCVTYSGDSPRELADIAQRVFSEADGLAQAGPPEAPQPRD